MSETETPTQVASNVAQHPASLWGAIILLGGSGIGLELLPQADLSDIDEKITTIEERITTLETARDADHESDHFWIACKRGMPICAGITSEDEGN